MNREELIKIFDYNYWAFERVWECISQISDEQFVHEIDYSTGSIHSMVVHMMIGNRNWMSWLQGTAMPLRLVSEDFDSLSKTKAKWDELRKEFVDCLNSFGQGQLDERVTWELLSQGLKSTSTRSEILLHLANHGTDHRAQILAVLNLHFHVKTVEQDMIYYLAEHKLE